MSIEDPIEAEQPTIVNIANYSSQFTEMDVIPKELQLPVVILVGLLGFLLVLGLSKLSAKSDTKGGKPIKVSSSMSTSKKAPSTPQKTPTKPNTRGTPIEEKTGTVMTPAGRRSARIARTRRKEE